MAACFGVSVSWLQALTYFLSFITSFFVCIPVGIVLRNFQGSCILFAQVVWDGRTIWPWSETSCDFVLYMTLAVGLFYGFGMGVYSLMVAIPKRFPFARQHGHELRALDAHDKDFLVHATNPVVMVINSIVWCLFLSESIVLSVGLQRFCGWLEDSMAREGVILDSCADAQSLDWSEFRIIRGDTMGVKGENFYTCLIIASIASWILLAIWTFQWILNFSQAFTMCSCEVAEEKKKVDQTRLIAERRSRIGTPGNWTPSSRYPPSMGPPSMGPPSMGAPSVASGRPYYPQGYLQGSQQSIPQHMRQPPSQQPPLQQPRPQQYQQPPQQFRLPSQSQSLRSYSEA